MDLSVAVTEFILDLKLAGRAERTIEGHELELKRLQRWIEEQRFDWMVLTRRELQGYARLRADKGHSSRSNMFCTLRTFYRWAVEQGYVALSPAAAFKTPTKPHPLPRALTKDQVRALLKHLREDEGFRQRRDETLMLTGLYSGLRACELAALRWFMIDIPGMVINIELSKMNKGRSVPIHPELAKILEKWRKIQGGKDREPVFSLNGAPINPNRVGKVARKLAIRLHIPLTAHVLRHSFATWMLRRSGNIYAVSKSLGHSQLAQTQIYVSADVEELREALETLPGLDDW